MMHCLDDEGWLSCKQLLCEGVGTEHSSAAERNHRPLVDDSGIFSCWNMVRKIQEEIEE